MNTINRALNVSRALGKSPMFTNIAEANKVLEQMTDDKECTRLVYAVFNLKVITSIGDLIQLSEVIRKQHDTPDGQRHEWSEFNMDGDGVELDLGLLRMFEAFVLCDALVEDFGNWDELFESTFMRFERYAVELVEVCELEQWRHYVIVGTAETCESGQIEIEERDYIVQFNTGQEAFEFCVDYIKMARIMLGEDY